MRRRQFPVAGIKVAQRRNHFPTRTERNDLMAKGNGKHRKRSQKTCKYVKG